MQTDFAFCMQLSLTSTKASNVSTGATACTCRWELQRHVTLSALKSNQTIKYVPKLAFVELASTEEARHGWEDLVTSQLRTSKLNYTNSQHTSSPPSSCMKSPMALCCAAPQVKTAKCLIDSDRGPNKHLQATFRLCVTFGLYGLGG